MEQFRTSAKSLKINVNDDGGYIELFISSDSWVKKFLDWMEDLHEQNEKHAEALNGEESADVFIMHSVQFNEEVKAGFEEMFGAGSYETVFGYEIVGIEYVLEFLEAILPYFEKRFESRRKALDKYSADRSGGAR